MGSLGDTEVHVRLCTPKNYGGSVQHKLPIWQRKSGSTREGTGQHAPSLYHAGAPTWLLQVAGDGEIATSHPIGFLKK